MNKELQTVPIQDIDQSTFPFSCSFPLASDPLLISMKKMGLINPLVLRSKTENKHRTPLEVVIGARRLLACQKLGLKAVEAFVFKSEVLDEISALTLNLMDNLSFRTFNLIETSLALQKLMAILNGDTVRIRSEFLPLFGLEKGDVLLSRYLQLSSLIPELQEYTVLYDLPLNIACELAAFSPGVQKSFFYFFSHLPFNRNKTREILIHVREICERDNMDPAEILQSENIREIISENKMSVPDKMEAVRDHLKKIRFPIMTSTERVIEQYKQELKLPKQIKLSLPPYLEGGKLKIELAFKNPSDLVLISKKLLELSKSTALGKIAELL